jgi:hypothetical protein
MIKIIIGYILITAMVGCSSTPPEQNLNPSVYYKNDICFSYERDVEKHGELKGWFRNRVLKKFTRRNKNQSVEFCGVGVLPHDDTYEVRIKHVSKLNLVAMNTCHREITTENPDKGLFVKDGIYHVDYKPTLESGKACPLYVAAYNRSGKHGWGVLVFENPRYQLTSEVHCNGDVTGYNGVSICESREGLLQKITFNEEVEQALPVKGAADRKEDCPVLSTKEGKSFEFLMPPRECVYGFIGKQSRKWHQFYTIGYEQLVIRGE